MLSSDYSSNSQLEACFSNFISTIAKGAPLSHDERARAYEVLDQHTGSDIMLDLLDQLGDLALLRRYLSKPLSDLNHAGSAAWLPRATADRNIPFIAELIRHGINIEKRAYWMISSAIHAQDADFLGFLRAAMGQSYGILAHVGSVRAIDECTPKLAPFIAEDLSIMDGSEITKVLARGGKTHLSLKCTAALLCRRVRFDSLPSENFHPALLPLIEKSRSTTGQFDIIAAEPSLKSVLGRPLDSVFFGFHEAISSRGDRIVVPAE